MKDDLTRSRKISTGYATLKGLYSELIALEKQKGDYLTELDGFKVRITAIEDAPRRITAVYLAKKAYADRFPVLLKTLEEIMAKKVKYNTEIMEMARPLNEMVDTIYQILMKREVFRYRAQKKQSIQSSIYEAFTSDPLHKLIKTVEDNLKSTPPAIDQAVANQIMSSIQRYITGRNERFTKAGAIINTSEINSKKHVLQTMIEMMKGVKIGSFAVPVTVNSKKVVEKMEKRDIEEVSLLLSNISSGKLTPKDESIRSFPKKFGKYFEDANSAIVAKPPAKSGATAAASATAPLQVGGANAAPAAPPAAPVTSSIPPPPANSAVAIATSSSSPSPSSIGSQNRSKSSIFGNSSSGINVIPTPAPHTTNSTAFFMEMIYEMLLTQGDEKINMVVNKLKETEQYLLKIASTYLDIVKLKFNGTGSDKITAQLATIRDMANKVTSQLETDLVALMKKISTTKELMNIRLIQEYIYMEVILIYIITYFIQF